MDQSRLDLITGMHLKSPKDSYLAFAAAVENQLAGNREKAIDIIERLIVHDPEYSEAYYKLGKMYENANKTKKARITCFDSCRTVFYRPIVQETETKY